MTHSASPSIMITRKTMKRKLSSAVTVFSALLILHALVDPQRHTCNAFVQPTRTLQFTRECTWLPSPRSELHLFKLVDQIIKGDNKKGEKEEGLTNTNQNGNIHNANNDQKNRNATPSTSTSNIDDRMPFVVERLGSRPKDQVFREIAEMCIA